MLNQKVIKERITNLKGTEKMEELIKFMTEKGYKLEQWSTSKGFKKEIHTSLNEFFTKNDSENKDVKEGEKDMKALETASDNANEKKEDMNSENTNNNTGDNSNIQEEKEEGKKEDNINDSESSKEDNANNNTIKEDKKNDDTANKGENDIDLQKANTLRKQKEQENKKKESENKVLRNKFKTLDNLSDNTESKETLLENVYPMMDTGVDEVYSINLKGNELVNLYLNNQLVYDPNMQRGTREDKDGSARAVFNETHIKNIANSMISGLFTPTQLHFGIIVDDNSIEEYEYDKQTNALYVKGKIKLIEGQHRTRALVKVHSDILTGVIEDIDLEKYVFNVQIHITTAEHGRTIYSNIDKMLKLDKSQVRHLGTDHYAKVINTLNQNSNSALKDKIATSRKASGTKLVLFSTLTDALAREVKDISSTIQRDEITQYLINFFDYVAYKLPQAFSNNVEDRLNFKKNNLLNENNFFHAWIALAMRIDKSKYKEAIDKIAENVSFFEKNEDWLNLTVLKKKISGEGYAMSNSSTAFTQLIEKTTKLVSEFIPA